mmetsp:Transcript_13661/g.44965  ORF Transcript_13661/g.44965 Transcript_13661/m.44965 type:complete len:204 (-) Transcript_13661:68-679(-)
MIHAFERDILRAFERSALDRSDAIPARAFAAPARVGRVRAGGEEAVERRKAAALDGVANDGDVPHVVVERAGVEEIGEGEGRAARRFVQGCVVLARARFAHASEGVRLCRDVRRPEREEEAHPLRAIVPRAIIGRTPEPEPAEPASRAVCHKRNAGRRARGRLLHRCVDRLQHGRKGATKERRVPHGTRNGSDVDGEALRLQR